MVLQNAQQVTLKHQLKGVNSEALREFNSNMILAWDQFETRKEIEFRRVLLGKFVQTVGRMLQSEMADRRTEEELVNFLNPEVYRWPDLRDDFHLLETIATNKTNKRSSKSIVESILRLRLGPVYIREEYPLLDGGFCDNLWALVDNPPVQAKQELQEREWEVVNHLVTKGVNPGENSAKQEYLGTKHVFVYMKEWWGEDFAAQQKKTVQHFVAALRKFLHMEQKALADLKRRWPPIIQRHPNSGGTVRAAAVGERSGSSARVAPLAAGTAATVRG